MSKLQDILKCAMCKETFTGVPVILNCCNVTVCESHVNGEVTKSRKRKAEKIVKPIRTRGFVTWGVK